MMIQGRSRALIGLLISLLVVFAAGCGGGDEGDDQNNSEDNTTSAEVMENQAVTGAIIAVRVGETAVLDGSKSSTTSREALSFSWSFTHKPDGSVAQLQGATTANPSFVADVRGTYMVQLVVTARGVASERAIATVIVTNTDERPTGPFHHIGLSSSCGNCHNDENSTILPKSQDHIATSNMCQACHTTLGFSIIPFVDHLDVFGNCSECHNGVVAIGKSEWHVETSAECDDCHNTTGFLELEPDGSFNHDRISRVCAGCHNGIVAIGKHDLHPPTSDTCNLCHTVLSFQSANVDHSNITDDCSTCHDGTTATGQTDTHPQTTVECGICHSTLTFNLGGVFDHSAMDTFEMSCSSCHNDINAIGKTTDHPETSADCGICHNTETFVLDVFDHSVISSLDQPCASCHNGTNATGKPQSPQNHPDTSSDCGNCHTTVNFTSQFVDHTGPDVVGNRCDSCHVENSPTATGKDDKATLHMPTSEDCGICHTPGTFSSGSYDHAGVVDNCVLCHDGVISAGKHFNHIPTNPDNQDCADCHAIDNFETFAGIVFDHVGIDVNNCALCHNGEIATGKVANHVPTTNDCSVCHTSTETFTGTVFNHAGIVGNCATCHDGVIAKGQNVNHIPTLEDCSLCHNDTNTGGFASTVFLETVHPGISGGCEGCHNSRMLPAASKDQSHLPTDQDCDFCHTSTAFTPTIFKHDGITSNCVSCHDGTYEAIGALGMASAQVHPETTADCGACHSTANAPNSNAPSFSVYFVDHTSAAVVNVRCDSCHDGTVATGKNNGHLVTSEDCDVCHVPGGTFATAVFDHSSVSNNTRCDSCHVNNSPDATGKDDKTNPPHIQTTRDCRDCHNTTAFAGARFDHQGIVDNCAACHNGVIATGKHNNHVPTNEDCGICHETTGFIPGTFDHARYQITDNCVSCHNGVFATGKTDTHVATNQDCGICHNTTGFSPATFDHNTMSANTRCDSCHVENSPTATGKDDKTNPPHIDTNLDCRACHTTATFVGGTWVHDSSTAGVCKTCHNGTDATGQPPTGRQGHFDTSEQCDRCHSTDGWAPTSFSHSAQGNYPGDHARNPTCLACHTDNSQTISYPSPTYEGFCAACHAGDYRSGAHGGRSVSQNKDCGGSRCHSVRDRNWD